ncbi:ISLre2 family transposase, partial [Bacillus sp. IITD106]|nr:ISLre2 family transposase [Bacillus sp. IITD106]
REKQNFTVATMFGSITVRRRKYLDRETGERVGLLDRYLEIKGSDSLSPFLTEMAVKWAVKGPSYRDARDRFVELLGYQAMSHEKIRQEVLKIEPKDFEEKAEEPKEADVLFLEVDGLHAHKQNSTRSTREIKIGVVHEGWAKRHPSSQEYQLKNKSYWHTLDDGQTFWEGFSRYLYNQYDITEDTHIVINGDAAPWIRSGVDYFENATYTYDRYHLKKWIKQALNKRSKAERKKAYLAADANDPVALLVAIAEAEKAETDEDKKADIRDLRLFILENQEAFRDYRELLQEKNIDTTGMRMMGAAESNMNLFSKRLKKMGYSWSHNGLCGMVSAMIHKMEGTLIEALRGTSTDEEMRDKPVESYPSFAKLLTKKTHKAIGAIQGHIPALNSKDQGKPYIQALRGLSGLQ